MLALIVSAASAGVSSDGIRWTRRSASYYPNDLANRIDTMQICGPTISAS